MRLNARTAGGAALVLFTFSSCAAAPTATEAVPSARTPCYGAYVSDVDTSVPGEPTREAAAVAWAKSVVAPSGAPTVGWKATDELTAQSGDWIVGVSRTTSGGWIVSGLGCGASGVSLKERTTRLPVEGGSGTSEKIPR